MEDQLNASAFRFWDDDGGAPRTPHGLVGHLDAILRASDIETVWALLRSGLKAYGYSGIIYGYSPMSRGPSLGSREDFLLLSTLDRRVLTTLVDKGYYHESITFNWALRNAGVVSWAMTAEDAHMDDFISSDEALNFFAQFFGKLAGCTIGFPTASTRGRAVMALIADPSLSQAEMDERLVHDSDALFVITTVAHRAMSALPQLSAERVLTRRQREVLEWVAEGKGVADIARILNLAQPTVEKHLRLARETLGVETTAHAVIKAAFLNQMFILPPSNGPITD